MLSILKQPIMVPGGGVRVLGCCEGVAPAVQQRCLSRMVNWVASVVHTLRAEFPSFETLQAWGVFNVVQHDRDMGACTGDTAHAQRCNQFGRLIEAFRIEATPNELMEQMASVRHLAARVAAEETLSSRDAWMRAAEMTTAKTRGGVLDAGRSPPSALLQLIIRYWAAGGSTSGVEQSFGKGYSHHVGSLGTDSLNDRMEILDLAKGDMQRVLAMARDIWTDSFGRPRASGSGRLPRVDAGGEHPHQRQEGCEGGWRLHRKRQLDATVALRPLMSVDAVDPDAMLCPETWTEQQTQELVFVNNKRMQRLAEEAWAGRAGALEGASPEQLEHVAVLLQKKVKNDKDYMGRAFKRRRMAAGPAKITISCCTVYIAPDVLVTKAAVAAKACESTLTVSNTGQASVFVVKELDQPSAAVLWNAVLIGGTICTWSLVATGSGPARVLQAALCFKRIVYMTDAFLAECPRLGALIVARAESHVGCKWRFTNDLAYFTIRAQREPTVGIALLGSRETGAVACPGVRHALTAAEALTWLSRTVWEKSVIGACGR